MTTSFEYENCWHRKEEVGRRKKKKKKISNNDRTNVIEMSNIDDKKRLAQFDKERKKKFTSDFLDQSI
jgi:hypothetical protein